MSDWQFLGGMGIRDVGSPSLANSWYNSCTTNASANIKGEWTELISAIAQRSSGLILQHPYADAYDYLFDIGIGAAGQETAIINNLTGGGIGNDKFALGSISIPLELPAGVRISLRGQSTTGNKNGAIGVMPIPGSFGCPYGFQNVTTYGANTAGSGGTSIDPGASANTKGAWTEIVAATTVPCFGFFVGIGNQVNAGRTTGGNWWLMDVGIGAAGNEIAILPNFCLAVSVAGERVRPIWTPFIPLSLPIGTRITIRAQCSINDTTDRKFDAVVYCFG